MKLENSVTPAEAGVQDISPCGGALVWTHQAYRFRTLMALFPLILGIFFSMDVCSQSNPPTSGQSTQSSEGTGQVEVPYNDYALFMAGMRNDQSSLAPYQVRPAWLQHARFFDQSWKKYGENQLTPMKNWAGEEIEATATSPHTLFYPFSGADFISMFTLFPRAGTYVMMGLEPVGKIPNFPSMNSKDFDSFFADFQHSLHDLLSFHYFVSAHMKANLAQKELSGVLPLLLFFMAREKAQIVGFNYWFMKADGTIREIPASAPPNSDSTDIPGLKILFKSPDDQKTQTLYYFRFNLYRFGQNKPFVSFLRSLAPFTSFMKSASYVMFDPGVSVARQFVLDQSTHILQEDSGIPLKYFEPAMWELQFYGAYTGPPSFFNQRFQDDLAKIYQGRKGIRPLPFGIGYHFQLNTSNLMLATRKDNPPRPELK